MPSTLTLRDRASADDLAVLLSRAGRLDDAGSVRLIADSGILAVYAAVIHPKGLLDRSPTVLGLRTLALDDGIVDAVVPIRSLQTRVDAALAAATERPADSPITIALPTPVNTVVWAAISPPRGGWQRMRPLESARLDAVARAGIDEIATAVPDALGAELVHRVRSEVWGRPIEGLDHIPAGAAFAALALGFLGDDEVQQFASGPWLRLTTRRGHVLVKQSGWSIGS